MRARTAVHAAGLDAASGRRPELDWMMLAVAALCCIGLAMAVSVQPINTDGGTVLSALKGHGARLCAGLIAFLVAAMAPLQRLRPEPCGPRTAPPPLGEQLRRLDAPALLFLLGLAATAATLVIGSGSHGARRWLPVGGITVQPVDFARLALVLLIAARLSEHPAARARFSTFVQVMGPAVLLAGVLLLQPDKGNAMLVVALAGAVAVAAAVPIGWFLLFGAPAALFAAWHFMGVGYSRGRIDSWLSGEHPEQVRAGLLAIESGGLLGQGLGSGWMKAGFVPEARNDFVFPIIGEELGFVGAAAVVVLFGIVLASGIALARRITDGFFRSVVFGCTMAVGLQAAVNLAVSTGLAPSKGIDLPFVSAGGSSLAASLAAIGLIGNAARRDMLLR